MNTTKIFTKAIFVVSILFSVLLIGCNDMIEPMAQVELTVRMDDHNIPLTSSFTLYGTKQESRATIQKELGSLNAISLLPLEPGIWDLTVEAKVEGIRKATGSRTVSVNKGQKVSAVIDLAYEYDLTFNANGGTTPSVTGKDVVYDAQYGVLPTTTKSGYAFQGWFTQASGGMKIEETDKFTQTTNQVLYAQWGANSYSITFDMQQGSGGSASTTATFDAAMQSGLTVPSRTGYTFDGYYDAANGSGTQYYTATMASARTWDKTAPSTTLYAKWTTDSYTITYNLNDGTNNAGNPATYTIESSAIALQAPTRTGYTFDGWYATNTFSGSALSTIAQGSTGNKTLYAKWTPITYSISYVLNDGTIGEGNPNSYTIETATIALQNPTRTGYTFGGWYETNTFAGSALTSIAQASTGNKTLYAKWAATSYTITYNLNDGTNNTGNPATYTIESATIALQNPTRTGYTFGGWFIDAGFATPSVTEILQGSTENKTLYAKWTPIAYSISYVLNDGTFGDGNPNSYTIETATITLQDPTRSGYTFNGWYATDTFAGSALTSIAQGSTGNKTLYAKWTADSYTITYNLNEGINNAGNPATYTIESSAIALLAPTRTGYTFGGWYATDTFSSSVLTTIAQGSTGNKTLYAKWTADSYTISYNLNEGINNAGNPATYTIESATIALQNPTRTGYTFGGWYETNTFAGSALTSIAQASTGNKTLYAKWAATSYTITYNLNDGTNNAGNPATYTIESATIALQNPTRTGYTFGGWYAYSNFAGSVVTSLLQGSIENKTLYAKWTPIAYSISYVLNDGTIGEGNPNSYTIESSTIALQNPTRTGYTFGGWYETNTFAGSAFTTIAQGSTGNKTLYAKWTATSYTITYNLNNGNNNAGNPATYTIETATIALQAPTRTGYSFGGWFSDSTFAGSVVTSLLQGSTENKTLYAKWTPIAYSISYVLNDGTIGEGNPNSYTIESSTIALQNPTRTGYTFGGWFIDAGFATPSVTEILQGSTENKTLYAKWTATSYTITYNLNDGTNNAGNPATYTIESSAIALLAPTRTGYTFGGWYATDTFSDTALTTIAQGSTGNKTLYAKWTADSYTISYNLNEGINNAGNPATYTIESATIALQAPTRNGYTFDGWYDDSNFTGGAVASITQGSTEAKNLYAKWIPTSYTITYNLNNGTNNAGNPATYTIESSAIALLAPTRNGYTFGGWFETDTFSGTALTTIAQGSTGNKTLYAKWTPIAYSISYVLNDGTIGEGNPNIYTIESSTIALQNPTRTGYTFDGWYADSNFTGGAVTSIPQGSTEAKNLYAKWIPTSYTITYNLNSGTNNAGNPATYTIESSAITLQAPTRTGYTFGGWYATDTFSGSALTTITQGSTGNKTLYAKWTATSYTITYNLNDGTNNAGNPTAYTIETATIPLQDPTRSGYTFGGWYGNAALTGGQVTSIAHGSSGNSEVWAKWTATSYTITYNLNEGTNNAGNPATYTIESSAITLLAPTRTGYTFGGWYATDIFSGSALTTIVQGSTGNKTLYAKWINYEVGGIGPAGGYIFHDKGTYSDGWRYMEAAPSDITGGSAIFGFYRVTSTGSYLETGATGTAIGTGKRNTELLVEKMNTTAYTSYLSSDTTTTEDYAANLATKYKVVNGGVEYKDWFLPSKDELNAMFENLVKNKAEPLGNFLTATVNEYWSSTEYVFPDSSISEYATYQAFSAVSIPGIIVYDAGYQNFYRRDLTSRVRPIRAF